MLTSEQSRSHGASGFRHLNRGAAMCRMPHFATHDLFPHFLRQAAFMGNVVTFSPLPRDEKEIPMKRYLIAATALTLLASPMSAFAQNWNHGRDDHRGGPAMMMHGPGHHNW